MFKDDGDDDDDDEHNDDNAINIFSDNDDRWCW